MTGVQTCALPIYNKCPVTEKKITESLGFILLEGSRRKDENDAAAQLNMPPASSSFGSLDSLNMADLDLALNTEEELTPGPLASSQPLETAPSQAVTNNPILAQFITMLSSFPEITGATVSAKNGTVLHQSGENNSNVANFITYVSVAAEQIEIAIGSAGRQYTIFTITDGSKLIILCGSDVVVGLRVGSSVVPGPIADGLRPILSRITLDT